MMSTQKLQPSRFSRDRAARGRTRAAFFRRISGIRWLLCAAGALAAGHIAKSQTNPPQAALSAAHAARVDATATSKSEPMAFSVKHVTRDAIYITGGTNAGMKAGMRMIIKRIGALGTVGYAGQATGNWVVARVQIVEVAATSAVCRILSSNDDVRPGDLAYVDTRPVTKPAGTPSTAEDGSEKPSDDQRTAPSVSGDSVDTMPETKPQSRSFLPSRTSGRVGFDFGSINSTGLTAAHSQQLGAMVQTDLTHIAGTHWNLDGTWRGRITNRTQPGTITTIQDVLNHTYAIQLNYDNPASRWVAGFGRFYLPWAESLNTIDGGYVGSRMGEHATAGIFAGSNPDPTTFRYQPDDRIGGVFLNFERGSFDALHFSSTFGGALSTVKWKLDRPFVFTENEVFYKRYLMIYDSLILDSPQGVTTNGLKLPPGVNRNYLTVRFQPHSRIFFDVNHNYFRDVPTADERLIATGLLDRILYRGLSVGVHVEPIRHIFFYTAVGQTNRTLDIGTNRNRIFGLTLARIGGTGLIADVRYSKFDSSFGRGNYKAFSLSRNQGHWWRWTMQGGHQNIVSGFTVNNRSLFLASTVDVNLGSHTFVQANYNFERGNQLNYNQWFLTTGYRFDARTFAQ
jgi:hypothetical protein